MTREIKFRAWSNEHNRYCDFVTLDENGRWVGWIKSNGVYLTTLDIVLEQDTGLKDMNGEKICEGDIVNLAYYVKPHGKKRWNKTYPHKGSKNIHVVDFEDGYFKFNQEDKDGYGSELAFSDYGEWEGRDCTYKYVAEVIGTIHENPELLEGGE